MCRPLTNPTTTDDQGHTLVYDAWNRLISVSAANGALITSYAYDAAGRRIEEAAAGVHPTEVYYDSADQDIEEDTGTSGTSLQAQYVWSPVFVNAMVFRDYAFTGGSFQLDDRVYVTQDADWSTTSLIVYTSSLGSEGDFNADGSVDFTDLLLVAQHTGNNIPGGDAVGDFNHDGNVDSTDSGIVAGHFGATTSTFTWAAAIRFDYSAYGQVTTYKPDLSGTSVNFLAWDYGFQGGWRDPGTGLIYFENRDYSPTMMRWVQVDPIQSGLNWYETDADNPISDVDPSGLAAVAPVVPPYEVPAAPEEAVALEQIADGVSAVETANIGRTIAEIALVAGTAIGGFQTLAEATAALNNELRITGYATSFQNYKNAKLAYTVYNVRIAKISCPCKNSLDLKTAGLTLAGKLDTVAYAMYANIWIKDHGGTIYPQNTNVMQPSGKTLAQEAKAAREAERTRMPNLYPWVNPKGPYKVVGHVPDTILTGIADPGTNRSYSSPFLTPFWMPMDLKANSVIGGTEANYIGKPINCVTVDGMNPGDMVLPVAAAPKP